MTPLCPRTYHGVRTWPSGAASSTRTLSPGLNRASIRSATAVMRTPFRHLGHLAREFVSRNMAALEHGLGKRGHPALVVAHAVVGFGGDRFDVLAQLVHAHARLAAGHSA